MIFCCNGCISSVRIDIWIPNQNGNNDNFDHGLFVHFEFTKTGGRWLEERFFLFVYRSICVFVHVCSLWNYLGLCNNSYFHTHKSSEAASHFFLLFLDLIFLAISSMQLKKQLSANY